MQAELVRLFERFDTNHKGYIEEKESRLIPDSLRDTEPAEVPVNT